MKSSGWYSQGAPALPLSCLEIGWKTDLEMIRSGLRLTHVLTRAFFILPPQAFFCPFSFLDTLMFVLPSVKFLSYLVVVDIVS